MKATIKPFTKWGLFLSLMTVGMISFMVMAGDESPECPMSLTRFLLMKGIALLTFIGVYFACKYFHAKGMFPEWIDRCASEED